MDIYEIYGNIWIYISDIYDKIWISDITLIVLWKSDKSNLQSEM